MYSERTTETPDITVSGTYCFHHALKYLKYLKTVNNLVALLINIISLRCNTNSVITLGRGLNILCLYKRGLLEQRNTTVWLTARN